MRIRIVLILTLLISILISFRIFYLSNKKIEDYNILESGEFRFKRGNIIDRNGRLLATSDELESLYANPKEVKSIENASKKISEVLNISHNTIKNKLKQKKNFVWIKRQITPQQAKIIRSLKIQGFKLKKEYKRFYPNKNLASQILGFCNIDGRGVEGVEKSMDAYLIPDFSKQNYKLNEIEPKGFNVALTIDSNIQAISEITIKKNVINCKADSGSLILLDGLTGEILCIANYPDFDPNFYNEYNQINFRNIAAFNQFEPGSVFKIFTLSAILDSKLIDDSDFYFCDGKYERNDFIVKCTGEHGAINYHGILKYSCNDGMLQVAEKIKDVDLYHYLKQFGFGARTSIKLPGEQSGILRPIEKWSGRSMFSIPIGQEISVNSLQIVQASTTFINDGIMIEPYVIKKIIDNNNNVIKNFNRTEIRRVLDKGISNKILSAMHDSTKIGGTVDDLIVEGIDFAAKSGTAEIYDVRLRAYSESDFTSSLITIFPLHNPRYILYIVFNKPKSEIKWGGVLGAETVNNLLYYLAGYLNLNIENIYSIKNKYIKVNTKYEKLKKLPSKMPNLTGLTAGDAIDIFSNVMVKFKIHGNGKIYKQIPLENEVIKENNTLELYLK